MMNNSLKGSLYVFFAAVLYGSYGVWSVLLGSQFGTFYQAYVRAFLVLLFLIPFCFYSKSWTRIDRKDYKFFLCPLLMVIFTQAPIYYAYQHSDVGITNLIFFSTLLIGQFIFAKIFLNEKLGLIKIFSFLLAIFGLALVFKNSLGIFSLLSLLMTTLGGVSGGIQAASTKLIKKYSAVQISILTWGVSFMVHLPISIYLGEKQLVPAFTTEWLYIFLFALSGLLSFICIIRGYKYIDASIGGLIGLMELVFAFLFGYFIFHQMITPTIFVGCLIIFSSATLPNIESFHKRK